MTNHDLEYRFLRGSINFSTFSTPSACRLIGETNLHQLGFISCACQGKLIEIASVNDARRWRPNKNDKRTRLMIVYLPKVQ